MTVRSGDELGARLSRRGFVGGLGAVLAGPAIWAAFLSDGSVRSAPVDDVLGPPDLNGVRLPDGFSSRILARSGDVVETTGYRWHGAPDGGAVVARSGGRGWSYVSNSELSGGMGGVSALDFDEVGELVGARRILAGTTRNCAGGLTPWGTWLSCEEVELGGVYECDPERGGGTLRPALGRFRHEAAAVDAENGHVYLTEDERDGRLYRFVPSEPGQVETGQLYAAVVALPPADMTTDQTARVSWVPVGADQPDRSPNTAAFDGGEGAWIDRRRLLFTTKGDRRVWTLDLDRSAIAVLHDCAAAPAAPLDDVDNIVVHPVTGDAYVAEDTGNMQLCTLRVERNGVVSVGVALQIVGQDSSEIAGPAFSPDGTRLYLSSQRGVDGRGITFEIRGPFAASPVTNLGTISNRGLQRARRTG